MKHSTKASLLSLIFPGAGLWYCGWRKLALANFLLAVAIPAVALAGEFFSEHIQWVILAVGAASSGFAHAISGVRHKADEAS